MMPAKDIAGQRFGRLVAIERTTGEKIKYSYWKMRCDCGGSVIAMLHNLQAGGVASCGCLLRDVGLRNHKHGDGKSGEVRLYRIWAGMKARCYTTIQPDKARYYRERGITVCDEWRDDYPAFRAWALENGYAANLSIDRRDNDGNYEPGNCRWATAIEQRANRRDSKRNLAA